MAESSSRRINISSMTFSELERAITSDQQSSRPKLGQSFLSIVDDSGKTMPITDIGEAYIALAYLGRVDDIRQIERESGISAKGIKHEAGMLAAMNGYSTIVETSLDSMNQSVEPLVGLEILIRDMQTIETITDFKPTQSMHDAVYSAMARWGSYVDVYSGVRYYARKTNSKPSPDIAQRLYEAVYSADKNEFARRVTALSILFEVPPCVNGLEVSPQDFVSGVMEREYHAASEPKDIYVQLRHLAMSAKPEFVRWMEEKDKELKQLNNSELTFDNAKLMWSCYRLAAKYGVQLPDTLFEELPRYFAIPLAHTSGFDEGNRSILTLRDLISSGLYAPNQEAVASAVEQSFKTLYEMLGQTPNRRPHEYTVIARIENIERLSSIVTPLRPASLVYIEKIRDMYSVPALK